MAVRIRKVLRDLLASPSRTLLVILAIAIGLVGISTTLRTREIVSANITQELATNDPAHALVRTAGADAAVIEAVGALESVASAEGRAVVFGRLAVGDDTRTIQVTISEDLSTRELDLIGHEDGAWPPPRGSMAIERSTLAAAGLELGDTASIITPDARNLELEVSTAVHDLNIVSGAIVDRVVYGYVSTETWRDLGQNADFNQIAVTVQGDSGDRVRVGEVAQQVEQLLDSRGLPPLGIQVPDPQTHILDGIVSAVLLILGSLGVLSLVLSGFLVFNVISAVLSKQRSQVGAMKAVGASRGDVLSMYTSSVLAHSAAALVVALPIGIIVSQMLAGQLGTLLNIDIVDRSVPAWLWAVEIGAAFVVPLAAALGPVLGAMRTTVAEALRGTTVPGGPRRAGGLIDKLSFSSAATRYAARNTFRNRIRLALTVVALSIGGAILVAVFSLQSSMLATMDSVADYWRQDVTSELQTPVVNDEALQIANEVDGVRSAEGWLITPASVVRADGALAAEEAVVFGVPPATEFISPTMTDGRWFSPGTTTEAVVNVEVAAAESELNVGDELVLRAAGRELRWELVGVSTTQLVVPGAPRPSAPIVYVPISSLWEAAGAEAVNRVVVGNDGGQSEAALRERVDGGLEAAGIAVRSSAIRPDTLAQVQAVTTPILLLLGAMAVLFAVVGALGLIGTMSLNVVERTRELGVVRAIGADSRSIASIVVVEGVVVATLSWILGAVLSVPIGWIMGRAVGLAFLRVPLEYRFAFIGLLVWLVVVVVTAILASLVPARAAARLAVRDAIAYE